MCSVLLACTTLEVNVDFTGANKRASRAPLWTKAVSSDFISTTPEYASVSDDIINSSLFHISAVDSLRLDSVEHQEYI